ncbi:DHA2 family efflux MFS transporter permease subunit [Pullulanibacillus sp. KACC 23026]|uniref:DHA2 family efflux MFS transporter permease subunit n=1 Tax=Pullulanibacillus sp. KACC 23026 TaxID=3028315 RepID=UPI0023AF6E1B|nr:DHA2 family efflux MFS transporter permease subunit [Pullulanibacillus sp. KACC 23026]WEG15020.1 DHA2 family efflux MFS transporter permease subunit [Pullulanibacillus sp. KACC 23026]
MIDPRSVHPISIVAVLILGAFTAILNQTLLNVALPKIQTDLNVSYNTVQWLSTGYMLVNGVLIPITAFLLETFTTRVLFIFAMSSFGVGTIFCALSPTFSILLVGRLVQGIGAGIIMPLMTNVMLAIFPPEKRGAAMGTMGVAMIFAPAVGPTLSGWIIENYSWRLLFYVVLPIIIIDLILAFLFLRNVKKLTFPKLDFIGVILSTIGFGGILYGFSEAGNSGWGSARVEIALIGGIISLGLFVWRQLVIKNPILQFRVFQYNIFSLTSVVNAVITMAMFAGMILTPIYLQNIRGFTPLQSGLLLLPGAIVMGIMSPVTGILYDKIGARPLAVVGLFITIITTWMFAHLTDATTYGHIMVMYTFRMFGMSMLMMPIMTEGLNQLPPKLHSHGTAMSNTLRQVSGSLGTAFLVTVMTNRTTFHEGAYANSLSLSNHFASQQLQTLGQAISGMLHAPAAEGNAMLQELIYGQVAKESTIQGINDAFIVATILAVIAFVLSFFIKRAVKTNRKPKEPVTDKSNLPAVSPSNELATDQS